MSDSFKTGHQFLLSDDFDVMLLVEVLLLFVEVVQFLVQRLIGLEIVQTPLDLALFPEPILSSAHVVQHLLDIVVA